MAGHAARLHCVLWSLFSKMLLLSYLLLFSVAAGALLDDIAGSTWDTNEGSLTFDVETSACGNADAYSNKTFFLLHNVEDAGSGILRGLWSGALVGPCKDRLPNGRNGYGDFEFVFDEARTSFQGRYGLCDHELEDFQTWVGSRANRTARKMTPDDCPDLLEGVTPSPNAPPNPTPTVQPANTAVKQPERKIIVDLAAKNDDGGYEVADHIDIGTVKGFSEDGNLFESEQIDGATYSLFQITVVLAVAELSGLLARFAFSESLSLASWNRVKAYEGTLRPLRSMVGGLMFAKSYRITRVGSRENPSPNVLLGVVLGLVVITADIGLLFGSRQTDATLSKNSVFSPVIVFSNSSEPRPLPFISKGTTISLGSSSTGVTFTRDLILVVGSSLTNPRNKVTDMLLSVRYLRGSGIMNVKLSQGAEEFSYDLALFWQTTPSEPAYRLPWSFDSAPEEALRQWLLRLDEMEERFYIRYAESFIGPDGAWGAYAESSLVSNSPSSYGAAAVQHLLGSLSLTQDPYDDLPYGSVNEDGALTQSDFPIAYGRRARLTTTELAIFATALLCVTVIVAILLRSREGTVVQPLLLRHFQLPFSSRLWQVTPEGCYVSKAEN
mmetsp:Transcript_56228/g.138095  ORF Transcript_56228/g.138095 Transcript_56228/m.138095 type:complete len:610 (+) Transcript_56228:147-1976(+)